MATIYMVMTIAIFHLCSGQTDLATKVQQQQYDLENTVYPAIKGGINTLDLQLRQLYFDSVSYKTNFQDSIKNRTTAIKARIDSLSQTFEENGADVSSCTKDIVEHIDEIEGKSLQNITDTAEDVVQNAYLTQFYNTGIPLIATGQNYTMALRLKLQACLLLDPNEECLLAISGEIEVQQNTLIPTIDSLVAEHQEMIKKFSNTVKSDLQIIDNAVSEEYVNILDNFIKCLV